MPKMRLTKNEIDKLKFTDKCRTTYWDTDTPGLGLTVGAKSKTFVLQLDVKTTDTKSGYKTVKKTLGRYGADITLEQAKDMVRGHVNKETGEAVLGERIKLRMGDVVNTGDAVTLGELVTAYFKETRRRDGKERKEGSAAIYKNGIEQYYSEWMSLTLKEVNALTPDIVIAKFQQIAVNRAMSARNFTVMLQSVLSYGQAKYPGALKTNPIAILTSRHVNVMQKIRARDECLIYDAEKRRNDFKVFWDSIQIMAEVRQDVLLFTLHTGMRSSEASGLEWNCVDVAHKELRIKDTKNRKDLHIPLSRQAMAIINRRLAQRGDGDTWVFPAVIKCKFGHATMKADHLKKVTGLCLTIHALRRTFITVGRRLKRYEDTDRLTNHVDGSMSGKHYDQTSIEDLRETCQMIGDEIERRMLAETATIIPFPVRQAA